MITRDELEELLAAWDAAGVEDGEAVGMDRLGEILERFRPRLEDPTWTSSNAVEWAGPPTVTRRGEPDPTDVSASLAAGGHVSASPERADGWSKADERPMRTRDLVAEAAAAQGPLMARALLALFGAAELVLAQGPTAGNIAELQEAVDAARPFVVRR